ncbi:unnamed protein product [Cylicocyclus nassatus]|uniref:Prolyl 4-hydroxylase alpha-subunit N-terminal domain-containing protein n=1 Tax=Cylicocyclus nassatus TaxID=53992 RepID=A0AA36M5Q7_CYLNA|nr:unnamed protein product [Cylicocyclus nassatus]
MIFSLGLVALCSAIALADLFTSMAEMQGLLDTEKSIPSLLYNYIEEEQKRLTDLRALALQYESKNDAALETGLQDISNPVNAFLLIKKKIFDWKGLKRKMLTNRAHDFIEQMTDANYGVRYPTEEDLTGAAIALLRLQDTYRLDTRDLAQGRIYDSQGNYTFDSGDCFTIAKAAYNDGDYYHTIMWMEEALRKMEDEEDPAADREEVLEYLSFSLYKQGNLKHALQYIEELYELNPEHPRAKRKTSNGMKTCLPRRV